MDERMTHEEHEERYLEALAVVRRQLTGKTVGDPEHTSSGTRFVHIDGFLCNDRVVLRMAWGKEPHGTSSAADGHRVGKGVPRA